MSFSWTAIVLTAQDVEHAKAYKAQLRQRQGNGYIASETIVLAVPDPSHERLGSGVATLNALYVVAEHISARSGYTFVDSEIFQKSHVLLIHLGGTNQKTPPLNACGKGFSPLPIVCEDNRLFCGIDQVLQNASRFATKLPYGLFVASTESIVILPDTAFTELQWNPKGVTALTIPVSINFGTNHGVCIVDKQTKYIKDIIYQGSLETLRENEATIENEVEEMVLLYTGIVFFSAETVETLLSFHATPPLDACTYLGVDRGGIPLRLQLLSDILKCITTNTTHQQYLDTSGAQNDDHTNLRRKARETLWTSLRGTPIHALIAPKDAQFIYLQTFPEYLDFVRSKQQETSECKSHQVGCFVASSCDVNKSIVINSSLTGQGNAGNEAVIEHSNISGSWRIGTRAYACGVNFSNFQLDDEIALHQLRLHSGTDARILNTSNTNLTTEHVANAIIIFGIKDRLQANFGTPDATFMNRTWDDFFQKTKLVPDDIWPDIPLKERNLLNAKLFPVFTDSTFATETTQENLKSNWVSFFQGHQALVPQWPEEKISISEAIQKANIIQEFYWRDQLTFKITLLIVRDTLLNRKDFCLLPIFENIGRSQNMLQLTELLATLDEIASAANRVSLGRVLACISDALAAFAENKGGLRSGPASNVAWKPIFQQLRKGNYTDAIHALALERNKWLYSNEALIRAARHYEGAEQVIIRQEVETAPVEEPTSVNPRSIGQWVEVQLPARIDLAGGWSDTPPIAYEHGGVVVNAAILLDGERPIRCKARRIEERTIIISVEEKDTPLICSNLNDLADYAQPLAPGALLKACILCLRIVSMDSKLSLAEQLNKWGSGLELRTYSNLPTGSGLGTSSILATAILKAVAEVFGLQFTEKSLIHAVLHVEQMLTTGGGWQDQIGGFLKGIKIASSEALLPLMVEYEILPAENTISQLNKHLLLVYTGRTRLARDLLQDVIRRWYARRPEIVSLADELIKNARDMKDAIIKGDLEQIGNCLNRYWQQKKLMALGAEPPNITHMIEILRPFVYGCSLMGAGGGGFMVLITKQSDSLHVIQQVLKENYRHFSKLSFHSATIDNEGPVLC